MNNIIKFKTLPPLRGAAWLAGVNSPKKNTNKQTNFNTLKLKIILIRAFSFTSGMV
jgi:hypothetical protein